MKLKKTTAAILVAGLTVAGSSLAFANETVFKADEVKEEIAAEVTTAGEIEPVVTIDPSEETNENGSTKDDSLENETTNNDTNEESKEDEATKETDKEKESNKNEESEFPEIPEGYTAGNLAALKQAYENAGSENAKQAILKNAHKAIAKFEAKHGSKEEADKADIIVDLELVGVQKPGETIIEPVKKVTPTQETTVKTENKITTKEQQKAEEKELKERHNAEKKALKDEHKAEKKNGKDKE